MGFEPIMGLDGKRIKKNNKKELRNLLNWNNFCKLRNTYLKIKSKYKREKFVNEAIKNIKIHNKS